MALGDPIEENNRDVEEARGRRGSRAEYRDRKSPERPRMDAAEVESELARIGLLLPFLNQLRLEELDREFGYYDAAAPILDPTNWIHSHENVERNRGIAQALLKAQTAIRKLLPDQLLKSLGDSR